MYNVHIVGATSGGDIFREFLELANKVKIGCYAKKFTKPDVMCTYLVFVEVQADC